MKLLLCALCGDVRALPMQAWTVCRCGETRGKYIDGVDAVLEGPWALALGFNNQSYEEALRRAHREREAGIKRHRGQEFTAFVIPWNASSVGRTRLCPCGQMSVVAVPGRPDKPCSCGRFALHVSAEHTHGVFHERSLDERTAPASSRSRPGRKKAK